MNSSIQILPVNRPSCQCRREARPGGECAVLRHSHMREIIAKRSADTTRKLSLKKKNREQLSKLCDDGQ